MTKMNNDAVGHAWYYHSGRREGDTGAENFFYNGRTIYSYGSHYPIARKTKDVILFTVDGSGFPTTSSYGSTTARHVSITRQAIPASATIIYVENPAANSKEDHQHNYTSEMDRIKAILKLITKGRDNTWAQQDRLDSLAVVVGGMNQYTKLFKLGKRQIDFDSLLKPDTLAKLKASEKRIHLARIKKEKVRRAQIEIENAEKIAEWQAGNIHSLPWNIDKIFLRAVGDTIQTSKGASISIDHAKKLFAYVKAILAGKLQFKSMHFGSFTLSQVDKSGNITIGCHKIEYAEMARIWVTL